MIYKYKISYKTRSNYPFDFLGAFVAHRCEILFETVLAVQTVVFLHETDILQWTFAVVVSANEVFRTPDFAKSGNKRSPEQR